MLTAEEIARGLIAQGVPRERAEAVARSQLNHAPYTGVAGAGASYTVTSERRAETPSPEPITLRIPWSALVSDNAKLRAARKGEGATVVLTPEYREARDRIFKLCADTMGDRQPLECPLSLVARVWVPDNRRRDVVNFSKALHDAMSSTIYADDSQLHDVRWIRAGVDVDAPRCELTITPL